MDPNYSLAQNHIKALLNNCGAGLYNLDTSSLRRLLAETASDYGAEFVSHLLSKEFVDKINGNTLLHVAVKSRKWNVAKVLVQYGASLTAINNGYMMPISFAPELLDPHTFISLMEISVRAGFVKKADLVQRDLNGKTATHMAARFCRNSELLETLFSIAGAEALAARSNDGLTFLNEAACVGNTAVLESLRKLEQSDADLFESMVKLLGSCKQQLVPAIEHRSPAMDALLHNNRDFLNRLVGIFGCDNDICSVSLQEAMEELIEDPVLTGKIREELGDLYFCTFAENLPTYVALHAGKHQLFELMVEQLEVVTVNQWDPKYKRTCLHWAVCFNRPDIVHRLVNSDNVRLRPSPCIQDADGRTALHLAFEMKQGGLEMAEILRSRVPFKEHEEKLFRDREIYVQALNAILVGATLIGSVAFAGWLQLPSTDFLRPDMGVYWWSNCFSFYCAVAAMCVAIGALLPTPAKYIGFIVSQLRLAVILDAGLLAISVAAFTCAFSAAGLAVLLEESTAAGAALGGGRFFECKAVWAGMGAGVGVCIMTLLIFIYQLLKCVPGAADMLLVLLPFTRPSLCVKYPWCWSVMRWFLVRVGESSRNGYVIQDSTAIRESLTKDVAASMNRRLPILY